MLVVAFEGACLSGKTTMVRNIERCLVQHDWNVKVVPEYFHYVGDPANYPPMFCSNAAESHYCFEFFREIEEKRQSEIRKSLASGEDGLVLMDRTILSLLVYRALAGDQLGYELLLTYVTSGAIISPDTLFYLLPQSADEFARREGTRPASPVNAVLFDPEGYQREFAKLQDLLPAPPVCIPPEKQLSVLAMLDDALGTNVLKDNITAIIPKEQL